MNRDGVVPADEDVDLAGLQLRRSSDRYDAVGDDQDIAFVFRDLGTLVALAASSSARG